MVLFDFQTSCLLLLVCFKVLLIHLWEIARGNFLVKSKGKLSQIGFYLQLDYYYEDGH